MKQGNVKKWNKLKTLTLLGIVLLGGGASASETTGRKILAPKKIALLVCDVGTIDTVAKTEEYLQKIKEFNVDDVPRVGEATQAADPSLAKHAGRVAWDIEINRFRRQDAEIAQRNRRMEKVYEDLRNSILGNPRNRDIVVAKNYLHTFLMPYSKFIVVIDRANSSIAEVEKAIGGNGQEDAASSSAFLTVIMQDQSEESQTVQVGNTTVKKTVYSRKAVANVRNYNGEVLFSCNAKASSSFRKTSASKIVGHDPASDLQEELLRQIAEKVGNYFTGKLSCKIKGPKGDSEFDSDAVILYLDGKEFENGARTVTGLHVLRASCDGYKKVEREVTIEPEQNRTITLVFRKEQASAPQNNN